MKRVLVAGATGALGKAVVEYLNGLDGVDVITTSRGGEMADYKLDIRDHEEFARIITLAAPDLILQLAATFSHDFDEAYAINVEANRQLLEIMQRTQIHIRILLVGSAAEYGVLMPEENPVSEDHVLNPVSVYGITKAWQTQLAGLYAGRGVDVVVARVFNLKGENLSEDLFVGRLRSQIDNVLSGQQSVIELGPLTAYRDYIAIEDAAKQIFTVASLGEAGNVYNIGSGKPVQMRELLSSFLEKYEVDPSVVRELDENPDRKGYDVPVIYANIDKVLELTSHDA